MDFEGFKMQKINIATARDPRIDEKNVFICLFMMFASRVVVIEM